MRQIFYDQTLFQTVRHSRPYDIHFRSNLDTKPVEGLSVSLNLAGRVEDYNQPGANTYENQMSNNVVGALLYAAPFVPMELEGYPTSGYRGGTNPLYAADHSGFKTKRNVAFETSAKAEYEFPFLKGLKAGMFMSWDWFWWPEIYGGSFNHSTFLSISAINFWPPKPGSTLITKTRSQDSKTLSKGSIAVCGFTTKPPFAPKL